MAGPLLQAGQLLQAASAPTVPPDLLPAKMQADCAVVSAVQCCLQHSSDRCVLLAQPSQRPIC